MYLPATTTTTTRRRRRRTLGSTRTTRWSSFNALVLGTDQLHPKKQNEDDEEEEDFFRIADPTLVTVDLFAILVSCEILGIVDDIVANGSMAHIFRSVDAE